MPINLIFSRIIGIPYLPSVENGIIYYTTRVCQQYFFVFLYFSKGPVFTLFRGCAVPDSAVQIIERKMGLSLLVQLHPYVRRFMPFLARI